MISRTKSIHQRVRFKRGGVFITRKQKGGEFMNIIEWRTKISTEHINYRMKMYWSAVNMETKAESSFQSATWLNNEEPSPLSPLNVQIFLTLIV